MPRIFPVCLAAFLLCACAEQPDGTFVINEETIENVFEKDKLSWNPPAHLNLLIDQPVAQASLPPIPPNFERIYGTLDSSGAYIFDGADPRKRGSSFSDSIFGKLGPAGKAGNAWFYADFNPLTGQIRDARAYLYGFMGGVCDMRKKTGANFGEVGPSGFRINIYGPCLFPQVSGATMDYALLILGERQVSGSNFKLRYIVDNSASLDNIPDDPKKAANIFDVGRGEAAIE